MKWALLLVALVPALARAQACCAGGSALTPGRLQLHEDAAVGVSLKVNDVEGSFDSRRRFIANPRGAHELGLEQDLFVTVRAFERAFDLMCDRAASRELAPGQPLGAMQMVQEWIAEARSEIDAARLLVLRAAWTIDRRGARGARDEIAVIKFYAANVLQRVLDRAIQAHGALGLTDETPLAYWYRHERGARIYDGADEVHKASLAQRILARRETAR